MSSLIAQKLEKYIHNNEVTNQELVQIIEVAGQYLNLKTRSAYAKENRLSYNGAKNHRENVYLFGVPFIIDND